MDSILTSTKQSLGITEEYEHFDSNIIMHINTVFMILNQMGVGPEEIFSIKDKTTKWEEFIKDEKYLETVRSYMYLKVRLLFDPPLSSAVMNANNQCINELEWRLNFGAESK